MELFPLSYPECKGFLLILIRVSVVLFMLPVFNARVIPVLTKAGLALILALVLYPAVNHEIGPFPDTLGGLVQVVLSEFLIGLIIGLLVQMFFEGVRIMGQLVGFQTGFAIANILDPHSGIQISILSNLAYLTAVVLFLVLNGHHILLNAMRESFEIINMGSVGLNGRIFHTIIAASGDMFVIAIKIGAPAIAALLFTKVAFGLIAKLIPQMNIMIVAFPVQIVIGLLFFGICLSVLMRSMERYLESLGPLLVNTMSWLKV